MQLLVKNADFVEFFFLFLLFEYTVLMLNSILTLLTIYLKVSNLKIAWLGTKHVHSTPSKLHYYAHHKSYDFDRFRPCERMRKHAFAGRNTQNTCGVIRQ